MPIHRGPGREREPDAIERMIAAFWDAIGWPDFFADPGNKILDHKKEEHRKAMLAAVRQLRNLLDLEGGNPSLLPGTNAAQAYDASNVIERIILEHERRAGGKGE